MPIKNINNIQYVDLYEIFSEENESEKKYGLRLLEKAYETLYLKTFPVPSEQESFDDWRDNLENPKKNSDVQSFSLFGFDLDKKNPRIIGLIVTSFYKGCATGLVDYIIREKDYSKELPAKVMLDFQEKILEKICLRFDKKPLKMILWEVNDPQKIQWDDENPDFNVDCMNPQKRINHIQKEFDCRKIGLTYAQAPIQRIGSQKEADENVCSNLLLFLYKSSCFGMVNVSDLKHFFSCFSKACNGFYPEQLNNGHINRMLRQISVMERYDILVLYENQTPEQRALLDTI